MLKSYCSAACARRQSTWSSSRAARICAAANGGQVLVSASTARACADAMPAGVSLRDLGAHHLKDLVKPEHLLQAVVHGLLNDFPPPRSQRARPHNLPSEATDFVGREEELGAAEQLLEGARLLTLIGPGGTGKTRLALRLAARLLPAFDDGVFFVPLASIHDPLLVPPAIAQAVGCKELGNRSPLEALSERLSRSRTLLVMDNFEQVLAAAQDVGRLLAEASELKVIVTSRAVLNLAGEHLFEVPPMATPDPRAGTDVAQLAATESVDLFVRRARALNPGFALNAENAASVVRIVTRLEGMPLAIELAAARIRHFPPQALAKRLNRPFKILSAPQPDRPAHHRTLRDAIAWSYSLLTQAEQLVFRQLGVFLGGFTLDAAEAVAAAAPDAEVLDAVSSLLDKSLLRSRALHGEARFSMLEMIREFAAEELDAAGEKPAAEARHKAYFLGLAEELEAHLTGRGEVAAVDRLTSDEANIQAALRACQESADTDVGLRISSAIWRFWLAAGRPGEGRRWIEHFLSQAGVAPAVRAKGLTGLGGLAYWQSEYAAARTAYEEALTLYESVGDRLSVADTIFALSTTSTWSGDAETGGRLADQALSIFEGLGARDKVGMVLMAQGFARWMKGDLDSARPLWVASLEIAREVGDHVEAATKTLAIASIDFRQGKRRGPLRAAIKALEELIELKNVTHAIMALDWVQQSRACAPTSAGACIRRLPASKRHGMSPSVFSIVRCSSAAGPRGTKWGSTRPSNTRIGWSRPFCRSACPSSTALRECRLPCAELHHHWACPATSEAGQKISILPS